MTLAIVHDWLVTAGGGENVLSEVLKAFPGTPVSALIDKMSEDDHERLGIPHARTTAMQGIPNVEQNYRSWLPLMPAAMRTLDFRAASTVLSISHSVAKAPRLRDDQKLLCLCLSPMRYAWDLRDQYLRESGLDRGFKGLLAGALLDHMREWDKRTSGRVNHYASISKYIADRVKRAYGRDSDVIYPPVDTEYYTPQPQGSVRGAPQGHEITGPYYVTASRFVPYKRVDLIVRAFAGTPERKLVVVGDGPDSAKVRAAASGVRNVIFTGQLDRNFLRAWVRGARAFMFAAEEDFGIAPVEAQACGVPVIAYGKGGALETIVDRATGLFFAEQTVESIRDAVSRFEAATFSPDACRANAERFSAERFRAALTDWVNAKA